jgi:hypothetical protein
LTLEEMTVSICPWCEQLILDDLDDEVAAAIEAPEFEDERSIRMTRWRLRSCWPG